MDDLKIEEITDLADQKPARPPQYHGAKFDERGRFSFHIKQLMRVDINSIQDMCAYFERKDKSNRISKLIAVRWLAARAIIEAGKNIGYLKEVNERNEGKVPDTVNINRREINFRFVIREREQPSASPRTLQLQSVEPQSVIAPPSEPDAMQPAKRRRGRPRKTQLPTPNQHA